MYEYKHVLSLNTKVWLVAGPGHSLILYSTGQQDEQPDGEDSYLIVAGG
jgi:hypothetical protein